jgi:hypothetical protein
MKIKLCFTTKTPLKYEQVGTMLHLNENKQIYLKNKKVGPYFSLKEKQQQQKQTIYLETIELFSNMREKKYNYSCIEINEKESP